MTIGLDIGGRSIQSLRRESQRPDWSRLPV